MGKKLFLLTILAVLIAGFFTGALAEKYEGVLTENRSLKYYNSFGLLYDNYDYFINPRLLGNLKKNNVITSITNSEGADRLQLGYGGEVGPGSFSIIFSSSTEASDVSASNTKSEFKDYNSDGIDDHLVTTLVDTKGLHYKINNDYAVQLGYGVKSSDIAFGFALGYKQNKKEMPYGNNNMEMNRSGGWLTIPSPSPGVGPAPAVTNLGGGSYMGFAMSSFVRSVVSNSSLLNGVVDSRTTQVQASKENDKSGGIGVNLGVAYDAKPAYAGLNILYVMDGSKADGSGAFSSDKLVISSSDVTERYTSAANTELDNTKLGLALRGGFSTSDSNKVLVAIGYETVPGKVKSGSASETYSMVSTNYTSGVLKTLDQSFNGPRSGKLGENTLTSVSLTNVYTSGDKIAIGAGLEMGMMTNKSSYNMAGTFTEVERQTDSSKLATDPANYTQNRTGFMSSGYTEKTDTTVYALPVAVAVKIVKGLELRVGGRYVHTITSMKNSMDVTTLQCPSGSKTFADGQVIYINPANEQIMDPVSTVSNSAGTMSQTEVKVGLGYEPMDNFVLDLLFTGTNPVGASSNTADMKYESNSISNVILSGLVRF
jgi:hypothetical protein